MYFGGVPTAIDVKQLTDHFGKPEAGLISYADIEAVLKLSWKERRFQLIVKNWRRALLRECNIDTEIEGGVGVRVLKAEERADVTHNDLKKVIRKSRRCYLRASSIPVAELNEVARKKYDHVIRHTQAVFLASTTHEKELTKALKMDVPLPRIALPVDKLSDPAGATRAING